MPGTNPKFSSLTPAFQHLVRLAQSIGYGRLRNLAVRDGEPTYEQTPTPTVVRLIKLGKCEADWPRTETVPMDRDYVLDGSILRLIAHLRGVKSGTIDRLEVVNGLPVVLELAEPLAPTLPSPSAKAFRSTRNLAN